MGIFRRMNWLCVLAALAVTGATGCGRSAGERGLGGRKVAVQYRKPAPAVQATQDKPVDSPFLPDGTLKTSAMELSWLQIPAGFVELPTGRARMHLYQSRDVPMAAVLKFFDARVFTGKIDMAPNGVHYRNAGPKSMQSNVITFDISVESRPLDVLLTIDEHPVNTSPPLSPEAASALMAQQQKRAE
jgi:hypothetical protein